MLSLQKFACADLFLSTNIYALTRTKEFDCTPHHPPHKLKSSPQLLYSTTSSTPGQIHCAGYAQHYHYVVHTCRSTSSRFNIRIQSVQCAVANIDAEAVICILGLRIILYNCIYDDCCLYECMCTTFTCERVYT